MTKKKRKYTDEELISELQRFYDENGKVPISLNMRASNGYIHRNTIIEYFGSWNKALEAAGFVINKKQEYLTGKETCYTCGNYSKHWNTDDFGFRMCRKCYCKTLKDYKNGRLNPNSTAGIGFITQRVVAKALGLELKDDCNCSVSFGHPFDLYDKDRYSYINVKGSTLKYNYNWWSFNLSNKEIPDTYILVGFDEDRKHILHVWITDPLDDLTYNEKKGEQKEGISITNDINSGLNRAKPWEVDAKPYDDMLHKMSLDNCSVLKSD